MASKITAARIGQKSLALDPNKLGGISNMFQRSKTIKLDSYLPNQDNQLQLEDCQEDFSSTKMTFKKELRN